MIMIMKVDDDTDNEGGSNTECLVNCYEYSTKMISSQNCDYLDFVSCLFVCLFVCLVGWLVGWLVGFFVGQFSVFFVI